MNTNFTATTRMALGTLLKFDQPYNPHHNIGIETFTFKGSGMVKMRSLFNRFSSQLVNIPSMVDYHGDDNTEKGPMCCV